MLVGIVAPLIGGLSVVIYRAIYPIEAITNTITVANNDQVIVEEQNTGITHIDRSSVVTVKDVAATDGYALTATLSNNMPGVIVTIYSASSSNCTSVLVCTLSANPTIILTDDSNGAATADGQTTTFNVSIAVPSMTAVGNYAVDIAYEELPNMPLPFIVYPSEGQRFDAGTRSLDIIVDTELGGICYYGTNPNPMTQMEMTGGNNHSQNITGLADGSAYTYYVRCRAVGQAGYSEDAEVTFYVERGIARDGDNIQSVTADNCPIDETAIYDTRDNHYYLIKKMADGKCWMLTNLAYGGTGADDGKDYVDNLGNSKSGLIHYTSGKGSSGWTISTTSVAYYTDPNADTGVTQAGGTRCPSVSYATTVDEAKDYTRCGYLYNWFAATAGTGTADMTSGEAAASICPVGWRLPTGGNSGEFAWLNAKMNNPNASSPSISAGTGYYENWLSYGAWRGVFSGSFYPSTGLLSQGVNGLYWSSTASYSSVYILHLNPGGATVNITDVKYIGKTIRCVAGS
jgi:uncharacterized protein (TIGR02145 family)